MEEMKDLERKRLRKLKIGDKVIELKKRDSYRRIDHHRLRR
jgi:hypothetical protein